jgi:DNA polymerase-3 subunit epsilon
VQEAIRSLGTLLPSMAIIDEGMLPGQQSCILMEKGQFYGMGYIPENLLIENVNSVKPYLNTYPETDYIRGLILNFAERWPDKVVDFRSALRSATPKDSI